MIKLKDLLNETTIWKAIGYFKSDLWEPFKYAVNNGAIHPFDNANCFIR